MQTACRALLGAFSCAFILIHSLPSAVAAEPVPGSSCAGYPTAAWQWSGAPENAGVLNGMWCDGTAWLSFMNIQGSGRLGLGTTTPATSLDIYEDSNVARVSLSTPAGTASDTAINFFTKRTDLTKYLGEDATSKGWGFGAFNDAHGTAVVRNDFSIGYYNGATTIYPVWIDSATGNIGIGTASPAAALHVVGDIQYTGTIQDISDRRAKTDIRPLSRSLQKLMRLRPVSFTMKDDPENRRELGFIAQDIEPLFPELVQTGPDGNRSMNYLGLIAPAVASIQEQQAEIENLRAEIETLKQDQEGRRCEPSRPEARDRARAFNQ